ncbi:hypothetical protein ACWEQL_29110 [Kitasatospora sp. NPDC004240]
MTADRTTVTALLTAAGILVGVTACSSSSSGASELFGAAGGPGKLSYEGVTATSKQLTETSACPFGLDLAAALKAAGAEREVTPGANGDPAVVVDTTPARGPRPWPTTRIPPEGAPTTMPAVPATTAITCNLSASGAPVEIILLVVEENDGASGLLLPLAVSRGGIHAKEMDGFYRGSLIRGEVQVSPGDGEAAMVRLPVIGRGDMALLVSQGGTVPRKDDALRGESLRKVTETLVGQLRP